MKKELVASGSVYQREIGHSKFDSAMIWTDVMPYLESSEIRFWVEICHRANMTKFANGTFRATVIDLAKTTGTSRKHATEKIKSLVLIGFIKRYGENTNYYEIRYSAIKKLLGVLRLNPLCGAKLRKVRGNQNVENIKNKEVREACKLAKVKFTECDFL